jgi:outer membrane lipoprotein-sorting protein
MLLFPVSLLVLAGCGSSTRTHTPPVQPNAQQLLANVAQNFNEANTLHGIFHWSITGRGWHESFGSEIWTEVPTKNRAVLLQSPLTSFAAGMVTVDDGRQEWLYDPVKNIVYTNPVSLHSSSVQVTTPVSGSVGDIFFTPLRLIQQILTESSATLDSASGTANGHSVYELYVEKKSDVQGEDYAGEVFIDKTTDLPVQIVFDTQDDNAGTDLEEVVNIPLLTLNVYIPDSIFTLTPSPGTKVLQVPSASESSITLFQAQQLANYHLLAILSSSTTYVLRSVVASGPAGQQIYQLDYTSGNTSFAIKESRALANSPSYSSGIQIGVRCTTGTLLTTNTGFSTLFWTERGVGIVITGLLSKDQITGIAQMLS